MEGVVIITVAVLAIVAGIYTLIETWNMTAGFDKDDEEDMDDDSSPAL